jgi:hypothetical protein
VECEENSGQHAFPAMHSMAMASSRETLPGYTGEFFSRVHGNTYIHYIVLYSAHNKGHSLGHSTQQKGCF